MSHLDLTHSGYPDQTLPLRVFPCETDISINGMSKTELSLFSQVGINQSSDSLHITKNEKKELIISD